MKKNKRKINNKKVVFVGLSGGVDSSVSALILKESGYEVVGVFIKTWQPDFIECTWKEERRDAMRVAAFLDIPFLTFDFENEYRDEVALYMIEEYAKGRTPNPDVMCNKSVKFGAFFRKAIAMGADFVATGHYALNQEISGNYFLKEGLDKGKDQSYFLWTLDQAQLQKVLFPIGGIRKSVVRNMARKYGLHTYKKRDSQGVCFLGKLDMKDFLKHYIKEKKGAVLDEKGEVIGSHDGVVFYTLGERHGFLINRKTPNEKPYYVIAKDIKKNTITVSNLAKQNKSEKKCKSNLYIQDVNWISNVPELNREYECRIRYHGERLKCKIVKIGKGQAQVELERYLYISHGQSLVLYDGDTCLGGGIISYFV